MDQVQNLSQAYSQAPWRRQMQALGLFLVVIVLAALIAGIYLSVTAQATTVGRDIQEMQDEMEAREQTLADLSSRLASVTSSREMEKRASEMGFRPIEVGEQVFIKVPQYTERQPVVLAPAPSPPVQQKASMPAEYTESLVEWLQRQFEQNSLPWLEVSYER